VRNDDAQLCEPVEPSVAVDPASAADTPEVAIGEAAGENEPDQLPLL
jgi:hypothetical protein